MIEKFTIVKSDDVDKFSEMFGKVVGLYQQEGLSVEVHYQDNRDQYSALVIGRIQ